MVWARVCLALAASIPQGQYHRGVRYVPTTDIASKRPACPSDPRSPCPVGLTEQAHLTHGARRGAHDALPEFVACTVSRGVLRARSACLHNGTLYLRTHGGSPERARTLVWRSGLVPWAIRGAMDTHVREWSGEWPAEAGRPRWHAGTWVLALPEDVRHTPNNMWHAWMMLRQLAQTLDAAQLAGADAHVILARRTRSIGAPASPMNVLWRLALSDEREPRRARVFLPPVERGAGLPSSVDAACFDDLVAEVGVHDGVEHEPPRDPPSALDALCARQPLRRAGDDPARAAAGAGLLSETVDRALGTVGQPRRVRRCADAGWAQPRITVIQRLGMSRSIANVGYLVATLHVLGAHVTVVALECLCIAEQIAIVANSSTLIGAHGAGLGHGNALPDDAAVIELRASPCNATLRRTPMNFRPRHAIVGAPRVATVIGANCSRHDGPWAPNAKALVIADIDAIVRAVARLDPIGFRGGASDVTSLHFFVPKASGTPALPAAATARTTPPGPGPLASHAPHSDNASATMTRLQGASRTLHARA
ncbi:hypothetical protein KFE25_005384 [Diacronema lutheri]|uniref:Glycosyltransferase 61 catalytic domain-containing protein n=3 Tax=Diacronema lutheri TaxID=2081491 RepID=A0A8J5XSM6_DIALT|nr:hypothetical protein KFE25_005384 [Diacronema lutheri]